MNIRLPIVPFGACWHVAVSRLNIPGPKLYYLTEGELALFVLRPQLQPSGICEEILYDNYEHGPPLHNHLADRAWFPRNVTIPWLIEPHANHLTPFPAVQFSRIGI